MIDQLRGMVSALTARQKLSLAGGAVVTIATILFFVHTLSKPDFKPLYTNMEPADAQALANLLAKPLRNREDAVRSDARQMLRMNRLRIVEAGKKKLQQILADRRDRALGRQVGPVHVVDAAAGLVRPEDRIGRFAEIVFHCA